MVGAGQGLDRVHRPLPVDALAGTVRGGCLLFLWRGCANTLPDRQGLRPAIPAGFDYDGCDAETFQKMEVRDGRLTLPGGMSYGLLVLAEADRMTPRTLAKVRQLVQSGATVIGRPPRQSPSLQDYPQADEEVRTLVAELWGKDSALQKVIDRSVGRGRVVYGKPVAEVLGEMAIVPDFRTAGADADHGGASARGGRRDLLCLQPGVSNAGERLHLPRGRARAQSVASR